MVLVLAGVLAAAASPRLRVDVDSDWNFTRFPQAVTSKERAPERFALNGPALEAAFVQELEGMGRWTLVNLPHSTNLPILGRGGAWQGVCCYSRDIPIRPSWRGRRVTLTFQAGMQVSDVWLGSVRVAGRRGGYLPIVVDLTEFARTDPYVVVTVRLDNRDNPLVPPGKPFGQLDFTYSGGLYRNAYLTVTDPVHITDALGESSRFGGGVYVWFQDVSAASAIVAARVHVRNDASRGARIVVVDRLLDPAGRTVATGSSKSELPPRSGEAASVKLRVVKPRLWSPESPTLYTLVSTVLVDGRKADEVATRIGIRSLSLSRVRGLILNGKPYRLTGTNRHQEYPWIGNALPDNAQFRDFYKIKQAGFNAIRLSHYPQSPAAVEACDELGLFVIDCIPGWQFLNSDPRFASGVDQDIRDTIRRDRNHPCVLAWETSLNETYPPLAIANHWVQTARDEFAGPNFLTAGDARPGEAWDLPYNQWDDSTKSRPQNAEPDMPGYIREYGDYEFGGEDSTTRVGRTEAGQLQAAWNFAWSHNKYRAQFPWTIGDGTWVMFDYARGCSPRTEESGISDYFRLPRYAFDFFRSQALGVAPMARIAGEWTQRPSPTKVVVFSNCDRVELRLNGKRVASQAPDSGPDTPYGDYDRGGHPFDGGNCRHLSHPPFTFFGVPYNAGTLQAVGFIRGRQVALDSIRTPGRATALHMTLDESGRPLGVNDAAFVYVSAVDSHGVVVPGYPGPIRVKVSGAASLACPHVTTADGGTASFLIRSDERAGTIRLTASAAGLAPATLRLTSR